MVPWNFVEEMPFVGIQWVRNEPVSIFRLAVAACIFTKVTGTWIPLLKLQIEDICSGNRGLTYLDEKIIKQTLKLFQGMRGTFFMTSWW
jgi:hypothetical protein